MRKWVVTGDMTINPQVKIFLIWYLTKTNLTMSLVFTDSFGAAVFSSLFSASSDLFFNRTWASFFQAEIASSFRVFTDLIVSALLWSIFICDTSVEVAVSVELDLANGLLAVFGDGWWTLKVRTWKIIWLFFELNLLLNVFNENRNEYQKQISFFLSNGFILYLNWP